jgi:hypothetical protein
MRTWSSQTTKKTHLRRFLMNVNGLNTVNPGFCSKVYDTGVNGATWLRDNTKQVAGSFVEGVKNVGAAVYDFFARMAVKISAFTLAAKDTICTGFVTAKNAIVALPKEAKIVGAIAIVVTAIVTALACRCFTRDAAAAAATPAAAAAANAAAPAAAAAAAPAAAADAAAAAAPAAAAAVAPAAAAPAAAAAAPAAAAAAAPAAAAVAAAPVAAAPVAAAPVVAVPAAAI